jgi:hypothetical protein
VRSKFPTRKCIHQCKNPKAQKHADENDTVNHDLTNVSIAANLTKDTGKIQSKPDANFLGVAQLGCCEVFRARQIEKPVCGLAEIKIALCKMQCGSIADITMQHP